MMKLKNNSNSTRGGAKGLTWFAPEEDQMLLSRSALLARIITTLAGRVTEQVVFGNPVTTGASNDLQQVTNIAWLLVMVCQTLDQLHLKVIIMSKCI
jgi:ATP-dependent Zn protease